MHTAPLLVQTEQQGQDSPEMSSIQPQEFRNDPKYVIPTQLQRRKIGAVSPLTLLEALTGHAGTLSPCHQAGSMTTCPSHPPFIHLEQDTGTYMSKVWIPEDSSAYNVTEALWSIFTAESKSRIQKTPWQNNSRVHARPFGGLFIHHMSKKSQGHNTSNWEEEGLLTYPWAIPWSFFSINLQWSTWRTVSLQVYKKHPPHVFIKIFLHFSNWSKDNFIGFLCTYGCP